MKPLEYHITTDAAGQVRLSKSFNWCNRPMPSELDAEMEAKRDAGGAPFTIHRKRLKALPPYRGTPL